MERIISHTYFARENQKVTCIRCNSQSPKTFRDLKIALHGKKIDLRFIDGDHSFGGVSKIFGDYTPFVRRGGLIAFHDFQPGYLSRYNKQTDTYVGDVLTFWKDLEVNGKISIIEDKDQDGFGIGYFFLQ